MDVQGCLMSLISNIGPTCDCGGRTPIVPEDPLDPAEAESLEFTLNWEKFVSFYDFDLICTIVYLTRLTELKECRFHREKWNYKGVDSHRGGVGGAVGEAARRTRRVHPVEVGYVSADGEVDAFLDQNSGGA